MRLKTISATFLSMACVAGCSSPAFGSAGGTAADGLSPVTTPAPAAHNAPVTAKSSSLHYKGPVYEMTAAGQVVSYSPPGSASRMGAITGGSIVSAGAVLKPKLLVPGLRARVIDGMAAAPMQAPAAVQNMIWTANQIIGLPYIWGGGHASFVSPGYDCSGTVSFALHGADLLSTPMDSSEFMRWDSKGIGQWVTIFTNPGHAYMTIAGVRLDTSAADDPSNQQGPRWRPLRPANAGFRVRHPTGL